MPDFPVENLKKSVPLNYDKTSSYAMSSYISIILSSQEHPVSLRAEAICHEERSDADAFSSLIMGKMKKSKRNKKYFWRLFDFFGSMADL